MLQIIIAEDFNTRVINRNKEISKYKEEVISIDDSNYSFSNLQNFIYPSLFSERAPFVHAKNLIEEFENEVTKEILKSLVESPTIFLLEEKNITNSILKLIEKEGGLVSNFKTIKKTEQKSNIFSVTNAITSTSKKERWLSYRKALEDHPVEAILGILYWKLRDTISKPSNKNKYFKDFYTSLMHAHKNAWQSGFDLELAIEKTILSQ